MATPGHMASLQARQSTLEAPPLPIPQTRECHGGVQAILRCRTTPLGDQPFAAGWMGFQPRHLVTFACPNGKRLLLSIVDKGIIN